MLEDAINSNSSPVVVGILAGGHSRRLGRPKGLITLANGKTMIEHIVGVATQITDNVVILGRGFTLPRPLVGLPVLDDEKPDAGPLAGLCTLLRHAGDNPTPPKRGQATGAPSEGSWALLLACDMPYLQPELIRKMTERIGADLDAIVFERPDRPGTYHACCALYHSRIAAAGCPKSGHEGTLPGPATEVLYEGDASLQTLLRRIRKTVLSPVGADAEQLWNLNDPEDLANLPHC